MKGMLKNLRIKSPAKVNLTLEILRKREDGYHELRTVLQKIALHDTLDFALGKEKGISITSSHPALPTGKENLVYKAARTLMETCAIRAGVRVNIKKRIPLGAGLGGGSSNAAATLIALNRLLELNLPDRELRRMGARIGADVPFFCTEEAAIGYGIGERLKPIRLPNLWYILIYPNFEVSTRWAYENFVLTKRRLHNKIHEFVRTPETISSVLRNDLETVVSKRYPQIEEMKGILCRAGALGSMMSGSGPTVFGIFSGERGVTEGYKKVKKTPMDKEWIVLKTHGIPM